MGVYSLSGNHSPKRRCSIKKVKDVVGLCNACRHSGVIRNMKGSVFYLCELSRSNPDFPKYPRLPVVSCNGYAPASTPDHKLTAKRK